MSFKYQVTQESDRRFVLPQVGDMRCRALAFLTKDLFEQTNEGLWKQTAQSATYEGVTDVFLMPDTHLGFGVPIGGVVRTENTLIQAGSGYDISCGMLFLETDLHASDVVDQAKRRTWIQEVESRIATGLGSHQPPLMVPRSYNTVREIFRTGATSLGTKPELCEQLFIPVNEDHFKEGLVEKGIRKAAPQLGSLGGGNHFLAMHVDPADSSVWLLIHCGSRGYGWEAANYFYYEAARLRGLQPKRREEAWLRVDERLGQEYWAHHNTLRPPQGGNQSFSGRTSGSGGDQVGRDGTPVPYPGLDAPRVGHPLSDGGCLDQWVFRQPRSGPLSGSRRRQTELPGHPRRDR